MRRLTVQYVSHQKSPLMKPVRQGAFDLVENLLYCLCQSNRGLTDESANPLFFLMVPKAGLEPGTSIAHYPLNVKAFWTRLDTSFLTVG